MVYRFPVLVSEDFNGFVTAHVIGTDASTFGATRNAAIAELKEYLEWFYEKYWWLEPENFGAAELIEFRVDVRPEYKFGETGDNSTEIKTQSHNERGVKTKRRVFAATETLALRAACVFRQEENGNYLASLPHFSIEFYFYDFKMLKQLVTTYVQENLKGLTPLELSRFLPARSVILEEITFNVKRSTERREVTIKTPNLNAIAEPIGQTSGRSKKIKAYERDAEITDLMRRLSEEQANIILLGESGTGKTTVLAAAVRKLQDDLASGKTVFGEETDDDNAETTSRHRFWQTNGSRLIAGMKYLGQWQERCEAVIAELSEIKGVLCAENLLDLISVGGSDPSESLAAFLMPFLERGELRMVIEAAPPELDACRRLLPGFIDSFEIVRLPEFTQEKALSLLEKLAAVQSHNSSIIYSQKIIDLIYRLFSRFLPYETFPGKTPIFLNELFEKQKTKNKKQIVAVKNQAALTIDDVIENFVKLTGLPELFLRDEIPLEISEIINTLASQVIGQPAACRQVANLVTTFKAGLNDPNRPLGVLLFAGQTGVGKTELAKALSRFFFGASEKQNENRLIRLDMSEYSLPGAASRLLINANGSPSELIQKVRQQPFCVVLFDEIEKAEPGVFDVLLNLFDEGRLTDRFGRVANFRSAVVILTSNLGAEKLGSIGFGENNLLSFEREARAFFRPEFFNRLDSIVEFSALSHNSINQIAEKELLAIAEREGLQTANIKLIWSPATIDLLVARGFDLRYGARPLQRTIENLVTTPLAKFLLANPNLQNCQLKIDLTAETEIIFSTTDFDS